MERLSPHGEPSAAAPRQQGRQNLASVPSPFSFLYSTESIPRRVKGRSLPDMSTDRCNDDLAWRVAATCAATCCRSNANPRYRLNEFVRGALVSSSLSL